MPARSFPNRVGICVAGYTLTETKVRIANRGGRRIKKPKVDLGGMFVATTATAGFLHEIRNMLSAAILRVDLLQDSFSQPEYGTNEAGEKTDELKACLEKILNFLDQAQSREYLKVDRRSVLSLVREALDFVNPRFKKARVTSSLDIEGDGPTLIVNAAKIFQVLINLLSNALEAVEHSENRRVEIAALTQHGKVKIYVRDHGKGVSPENTVKIFDPLFSTKKAGRNQGLGLAISKQIVEQHGGRLFLENAANPTSFCVELPILSFDKI